MESKKCVNCGKELAGEGVSIYAGGKLAVSYCSTDCMKKVTRKMRGIIKKMTREELEQIIKTQKVAE